MAKNSFKRFYSSGPVLRPLSTQFYQRYKRLPLKEWYEFCRFAVRRRS